MIHRGSECSADWEAGCPGLGLGINRHQKRKLSQKSGTKPCPCLDKGTVDSQPGSPFCSVALHMTVTEFWILGRGKKWGDPQRRNDASKGQQGVREQKAFCPSLPVCVPKLPRLSKLPNEEASLGQGTGIQVSPHVTLWARSPCSSGVSSTEQASRNNMTQECQEGAHMARADQGHGWTRKLDIYFSMLMIVNALDRSMQLTKDVNQASIQREAIKMIKGSKKYVP